MTISQIKAANKAAGFFFFSPSTMRFFNSKVHPVVQYGDDKSVYFVTSEQFVGSDGVAAPRKYTVRRFNRETSDIRTVDSFNDIATLGQARKIAKQLASADADVWMKA